MTHSENGLEWNLFHDRALDLMGLIPSFLHAQDPRPAKEQFAENYAHGGGWSPMKGWQLMGDVKPGPMPPAIQYPGDEGLVPVAWTMLGEEERVVIYPNAWVMIQSPRGFEVARMD